MKNQKLLAAIICGVSSVSASSAMARPISYPGGWTILQTKDGESFSLGTTYTVTKDYALGYKGEYFEDEQWQMHTATFDYILKKINMPASQANFYLKNGIGFAHSDYHHFDNKNELAAYTGLSADWEDRRYMVKYENKATYAGDIDKSFMQKTMFGVAPYIGDYGDLHTWIMLDLMHMPDMEDKYVATPYLRFFKDTNMLEVGVSNQGDLMLNSVIRF
jgi:hypothetical protein